MLAHCFAKGRETWRADRVAHPALRLLLVTDEGDRLVYIGLGARLGDAVAFAHRHGARLVAERRTTSARSQLLQYLAGERRDFELPLRILGSEFQQRAWQALRGIPYGHTMSYAEQAEAIGKPQAARAVGRANGENPLPIVLPCHRVLGQDGKLVGFGGGLELKRFLLALESPQRSLAFG